MLSFPYSACSAAAFCLQQQGREVSDEASAVDAAVTAQMRGLIVSGEPHTERKSTFQVCHWQH
jgi:hypothetical protein